MMMLLNGIVIPSTYNHLYLIKYLNILQSQKLKMMGLTA